MSGGFDILKPQEGDITKMLAATTHIGSSNSETTMEQYIFKRRTDGVNIINIRKTWEKMLLAARAIASIENPADVFVVSSRNTGQRAVLKFARYVGATPIAGRFTPGAFTNQIQAAFREPRLLIITDCRADHQPVNESSYSNIPVIALANVDSPTKYIDIAIPCNTKTAHSIGLMFWFLSREVLRLRGTISREITWDVMPDLFFFRDDKEVEEQEAARQEAIATAAAASNVPKPIETENWGGEDGMATDWSNEPVPASGIAPVAPGVPGVPGVAPKFAVSDDWAAQPTQPTDWAAESAPPPVQPPADQSNQWGGGAGNWS